jgi:hypothetical protein
VGMALSKCRGVRAGGCLKRTDQANLERRRTGYRNNEIAKSHSQRRSQRTKAGLPHPPRSCRQFGAGLGGTLQLLGEILLQIRCRFSKEKSKPNFRRNCSLVGTT